MNHVSVTRLRLRKWRFFPAFAYYAVLSMNEARRTPGNLNASARMQRGLVFWTITVWNGEQAMRAFRNGGSHKKVMPKLADWCDEGTYVHWLQESESPPGWREAHERMVREGIVSRVKHPSPNHAARNFPAFKS